MSDKAMVQNEQPSTETYVTPAVDICEKEQELLLYADMPGVVQDNLSLDFDKGVLTIDGWYDQHINNDGNAEIVRYHYRRRFGIGNKFDPQQADATLDGGVLSVKLPRLQATLPQKIEVKVANS